MHQRYDAIVLGLGAMGSAAAYHLAARGLRVAGIEQFEPGHDRGSSHGGSRMIRQSYFEGAAYVPLLLRAYELWRALEHDTGENLLVLTGGLYLGPPDSRTVAGALQSARRWSLPYELLGDAEIRRRFPVLAATEGVVGLLEPEAGFVRPELAIRAHLARAHRAGADLRTGERGTSWEPDGDGVRVTAGRWSLVADRLVVTAGSWAPQLLAGLGLPITVERQVQYWFRPRTDLDRFAVGVFPCWVWESEGVQTYGFPALDGAAPKVGFFRLKAPTTADTVDRVVHDEEVGRMRRSLAGTIPSLAGGALEQAKTCLYTTSADEHFIIDVHPRHPQVVFATGFSGHGYKFAPVVGEMLADLVTHGSTRHDRSLFAAGRFTPTARP